MAYSEELDLRDVVHVVWKRKISVFISVVLFLLIGGIYRVVTPEIYQGKALMEMGEIVLSENLNSKKLLLEPLDQTNELLEISETLFSKNGINFKMDFPRGNSRLIRIICQSKDKEIISSSIKKAINIIQLRHNEKAEFYKRSGINVRPTSIIENVNIAEDPVNPNLKQILIRMVLLGLVSGFFFVFFQEYIIKAHSLNSSN